MTAPAPVVACLHETNKNFSAVLSLKNSWRRTKNTS